MNISELSLKRPVLATVMNIMIIVFGITGFTFLAVRDYPAIDPAVVNVSTSYTGANADIIESQITEPLEKQINGIPGIRTLTSSSSLGSSNITVEFNLGIDLEAAELLMVFPTAHQRAKGFRSATKPVRASQWQGSTNVTYERQKHFAWRRAQPKVS